MPDLEEDRSKENATQDGAENFSETSTDSKPLSKRCSERSGRRFIQSGPPETKSCLVAWSRDVFIAALCAVLLSLAAQYLPGIGLVASVFLPLPIAMALMRQGILGGVFSGVLMLLILIFIHSSY